MKTRTFALVTSGIIAVTAACFGRSPQSGDVVWAQWKPNAWYHGKVTAEKSTGHHVLFDDGDRADRAPALVVLDRPPPANTVKTGARVLAEWTDRRYYPGTVIGISSDGRFKIRFDDGDSRTVGAEQVRLRTVSPGRDDNRKTGEVIWAQWSPNGWYHGKVTGKHPTGFHVLFDDGDEADLAPPLIVVDRPPAASSVKAGARVLGRWTDGRYYPGTVASVTASGKYDIQFDDGDNISVPLASVRLLVDE